MAIIERFDVYFLEYGVFFSQNLRILLFSVNTGFDLREILYISPFFFTFMDAFDAKFCCCEGLGCEFSARL